MILPSPQSMYDVEYDADKSFEKISTRRDGRMPVGRQKSALRGARKTAGSRRASRFVSRHVGGSHRRRNPRILDSMR